MRRSGVPVRIFKDKKREAVNEQVTFEQRPEEDEGVRGLREGHDSAAPGHA